MRLIDTHCHLNHRDYAGDRDATIARAHAAGVEQMVVIGYDLPSSEAALALAEGTPSLFATVGIHPHDAKSYSEEVEARLLALAAHPKVLAIGEIGLDFYRDLSPRDVQESVFRRQITIARELRLPMVFHTRESESEVLGILEEEGMDELPGILHCFSSGEAIAERALALGLHLGIGGVVTFKNARALHETVALLPLDRLVIETDCPYLAPHPHRGRRNEPSHLALVAAKVAALHGRPVEEIATATTANATAVFGASIAPV